MTAHLFLLTVLAGALSGCAATKNPGVWTYDHGAVIRADAGQSRIALIFTGGDHGQASKAILDILAEEQVRASFFLTGGYLANPNQRALVDRMVEGGHFVGPHSHAHPLYCSWDDRSKSLISREYFESDLRQNIGELRQLGALAPGEPVFFIPPYEWFNRDQVRWADAMGVRLFNFTPGSGSNRDWIPETDPKFVSSRDIVSGVLDHERAATGGLNGFLLLFHLGSTRHDLMDEELRRLITTLKGRGYSFARVDELLR